MFKVKEQENHNLVNEAIRLKESNYQLGRQIDEYKKVIDDLKTEKELLIDKNFTLTRQIRSLEQEIEGLKKPKAIKCCRRVCCKGE